MQRGRCYGAKKAKIRYAEKLLQADCGCAFRKVKLSQKADNCMKKAVGL